MFFVNVRASMFFITPVFIVELANMDCDSERALGVDHDQMSNYDLDVPPVSGNEYLQRVQ